MRGGRSSPATALGGTLGNAIAVGGWLAGTVGRITTAITFAPMLVASEGLPFVDGRPSTEPSTTTTTVRGADGSPLHVRVSPPSRGPSFLLTHGLGCDHSIWNDYVPALAEHGQVIAWDLRGHGASRMRTDPQAADALAPPALAADLEAVAELASGPLVLVGHSLGGVVTLLGLRDHQDLRQRTAAAVVIATPPTDIFTALRPVDALAIVESALVKASLGWLSGTGVAHQLMTNPLAGAYSYATVRAAGFGSRPAPAHVRRLRDQIARTPSVVRRAVLSGSYGTDLRGTLADVRTPTLVVIGGQDCLVHPKHAEALRDELPVATSVVYPDAGHAVMLERHADITRRILEIATHSTASMAQLGEHGHPDR